MRKHSHVTFATGYLIITTDKYVVQLVRSFTLIYLIGWSPQVFGLSITDTHLSS